MEGFLPSFLRPVVEDNTSIFAPNSNRRPGFPRELRPTVVNEANNTLVAGPWAEVVRFEDLLCPRWLQVNTAFLSFLPLNPIFKGPCLEKFSIIPDPIHVSQGQWQLPPATIEAWSQCEAICFQIMDILRFRWGFVTPLLVDRDYEISSNRKGWKHIVGILGSSQRVDDKSDYEPVIIHFVEAIADDNKSREWMKQQKELLVDLEAQLLTPLPKAVQADFCGSNLQLEYMISTRPDWHTVFIRPVDALRYLRYEALDIPQIFFKYGIPFRTLASLDRQPHARAARMSGGIIWRLAAQYVADEEVLSGPSATATIYGHGYFIDNNTDDSKWLCDDMLSTNELDLI
ncbi:hypothetical protein AX16_007158 [Volvariella volvacea WC 439]|nr:hypothetical protein AX16_007158 [Volvariella volvacea WC 439]